MKKILSIGIIVLLALALVACGSPAYSTEEPTTTTQATTTEPEIDHDILFNVWVDGQNVPNSSVLRDEEYFTTHVSLLPVLAMLDLAVDMEDGVVTMTGLDGRSITFTIGSNEFDVNGETVQLDAESLRPDDDGIYVPVAFFRTVFGAASVSVMTGEVYISTHATDDMF
ncbi:MAG: copper amine oxidase N-terminal domain-containing protein [Oscillospiraceae bacterium]|nr:copper amine oxidase N-terminal domain-containing protein [Oscillospiraceae bacterium]